MQTTWIEEHWIRMRGSFLFIFLVQRMRGSYMASACIKIIPCKNYPPNPNSIMITLKGGSFAIISDHDNDIKNHTQA